MSSRHRTRLWVQALEDRRVPATFTVNTNADSGVGTLRQAILDSNAASGADNIVFDSSFSTAKTISLLSALPNISDDLTITGPGSKLLTVTRDASASDFRIFNVKNLEAILTVNLSGLKLTNGICDSQSQTDNGGGILVGANHTLSLDSMVISGNTSTGQGGGIAMAERSRLSVTNSTVSGNAALGNVFGSPNDPAFSGVGGGIYFTQDGDLTLISSTVDNNTAKVSGAGIFLYGESMGTAPLRNATVSSNSVTSSYAGLLYNSGGGGIAVLTNAFASGSGVFALTVQNSTITGNQAAGSGQGGGIQLSCLQSYRISARIESCVIAGNNSSYGPDIYGDSIFSTQPVTVDYSAIGSTADFSLTPGPGGNPSNQFGPVTLGALAYNPSTASVRTHLPPANSPLIDKGSNPGAISTDARGMSRYYDDPSVAGPLTVDIGAAEVQPAGLPTATGRASTITTAGGNSQTVTVTFNDDTGLNTGTIGTGDIKVTGPNGYSKTGTWVSTTGSGTSVTVTYTVASATPSWSTTADGIYTISTVASQVADISGNAVPAGPIGTFQVAVPRTIIVTTANDVVDALDGVTSLREAIASANSLYPSNDTISFDPTVFLGGDVITWSLGQMFITDSVTIQGTGPSKLTFDGGSASRHFNIDGPGVLNVTISGVSMSGGLTTLGLQSERGGSIYDNGEILTLDNVWMTNNNAQKAYGGAIHLQGQANLTFKNGRLNTNSSPNFAGGAISALDAGHTITISNSTVTGNIGGYYGGAVFSSGGGTVTIDRCTIKNNSTTLVISDDQGGTIITGGGGAIMVANGKVINGSVLEDYPSTSSLTVSDSLFDGNKTAVAGGAIEFNGNTSGVVLRNSTFVNNQSTGNTQDNVGGAVLVGNLHNNPVQIYNCTFAYNKAYGGGGLFIENDNSVSVQVYSSIFAQNSSADPTQIPPDIDGSVIAYYCFIGVVEGVGLDPSSSNNIGNGGLGSPANPYFTTVGNYGGPTSTLGLAANSPCRDTGSNPLSLSYDQRGAGYARISNGKPDIGAFEYQVVTAPTVTSVVFGDGTNQRSLVKRIVATFSEAVNFMGGVAAAFTVHRSGTGGTTGDVSITANPVSGPASSVTITFSGSLTEGVGSLVDGFYNLIIGAAQVSGVGGALDGNNDGTSGGDYTVTGTTANKYFRLFGDSNGDAVADLNDFTLLRGVYNLGNGAGPLLAVFDYDNDGNVGLSDFTRYRTNFNLTP